jgi:dihydrofolate synthase/folylpolyglutamate synthase
MEYRQAVEYLESHIGAGFKPGLDRIATLVEMMGHPEDGYPIIHVAGTNGKTSTCRIATMIASAHGLNTGLFTSPHLQRIEERLGVNGRSATPEEFAQAVSDVAAFADIFEDRYQQTLSYFELTAAMAFSWFAEMAVDAAVIEVGLGGRLDATNVVRGDVAVVTGISRDHTGDLGETVEEIAGEKLGIVKPGSVLVTGPLAPAVEGVAVAVASTTGASHIRYGVDYRLTDAAQAVGGWLCHVEGAFGDYDDILLPLHGRHQTVNLAVAVAAVEALTGRSLDPGAARMGAAAVTAPGRLEPFPGPPIFLLDGAHNPEGFTVLGESLRQEFASTRWVALLAVMEDKELDLMLPELAGTVTEVVATTVTSPRARRADDLAKQAARLLGVPTHPVPDLGEAVEVARRQAGEEGGVLVAGSLYLVGAVRDLLTSGQGVQPNER